MYIVTNVVSDYILLTVFVKFYNLSQLLCNFCPICRVQWKNKSYSMVTRAITVAGPRDDV